MAKGKGFSTKKEVAKGSGRTDGGTKVTGSGKGNTVGKTTVKHGK